MKYPVALFLLFSLHQYGLAQGINIFGNKEEEKDKHRKKLFQKNHGAIIGLQRGAGTSFEMGYEAHWRKMSLLKPRLTGATANLEYNPFSNVIGYKAGLWMKKGRINLTYGGNVVYFDDFKGGSRFGLGPSVGFRLAGFHFVNGLNILTGNDEVKANTLHASLRYYFPVQNSFTWDRQTRKRKAERKARREAEDRKGLRKIFNFEP